MHDPQYLGQCDTGYCEDFVWPFGTCLDPFPEPVDLIRFPGVSQEKLPNYIFELRTILWARYSEEDRFPETVKVVRSKHVLWTVRETPGIFPHLAALSDRELMRITSMILRDMQQQVLNNKNRGKFLVVQGV